MTGVAVKIKGGDRWKKVLEPYIKARNVTLNIGIMSGSTYPDGTSVAFIGMIHEFGTSKTPARSFLRSTLEEKQDEWIDLVANSLKVNPSVESAFTLLGEIASKDIQMKIESGINPSLNPKTVLAKQRKGKTKSSLPLIDTGILQEAIQYEVVINGS
jgi:hypothetical protein